MANRASSDWPRGAVRIHLFDQSAPRTVCPFQPLLQPNQIRRSRTPYRLEAPLLRTSACLKRNSLDKTQHGPKVPFLRTYEYLIEHGPKVHPRRTLAWPKSAPLYRGVALTLPVASAFPPAAVPVIKTRPRPSPPRATSSICRPSEGSRGKVTFTTSICSRASSAGVNGPSISINDDVSDTAVSNI